MYFCLCLQLSYSSLLSFVYFFTGIVGPLLTGYLLEVGHRWDYIFKLNALVLILGASVFLIRGTAKKIV